MTQQPRLLATGLLIGLCVGWTLGAEAAGNEPRPQPPNRELAARVRVPEGFVVEQVAAPPLVGHPMMACFDERGRLFVADSAGRNLESAALLKDPPSFIRLLEDTDGDGRFDKSTIFADRMTMPMGVLWYRGALYTASPPSLWRLEDRDGDGRADRRRELVTRFGFTGNAADIHGPFLGPDGRLYWTDGRHGYTIQRPGDTTLTGEAARIFRCRPDGTDVEAVCGGGMDDPVEVAFTPEGEPFATVDILIGQPSRIDAIIYAIEGGAFPYYEPVLHEFKRTGDLLPAVSQLGWVAPSGLMRYRGGSFGPAYRDNLFSAQFNMRRVQRHPLQREGAAFQLRNEDFLVSSDPDFHPTDVLEDADGSLLVLDTGSWFSHCPTSQLRRGQVAGGIYRVRRQGAAPPASPRGLALDWDRLAPAELARLLDDPRFAVRDRAVDELARQVPRALPALREVLHDRGQPIRARRNAVWALTRGDDRGAQAALCQALRDPDLSVRLAAAHAVGLNRIAAAFQPLLIMVGDDAAAARRAAATALGRLRRHEAVPTLLAGLRAENDRFLDHSLIYALIVIADRRATLVGLSDPSPRVRRGALIALDQMDGGDVAREDVVPLVGTTDAALQKAVFSVIARHPDWAGAVAGLLQQWAASHDLDEPRREGLRETVPALATNPAIQQVVAQALQGEDTRLPTRLLLIEAIARAPLKRLPPVWTEALGRSLRDHDDRVLRQAIAAARAMGGSTFDEDLRRLGSDPARPAELRVAAWAAVAPRAARIGPDDFAFLRAELRRDNPPLLRLAAAEALGTSRLDDRQLVALVPSLAQAGPLELPPLLGAYERSKDPSVAKDLLAALAKAPGLQSLSAETLRRVLAGSADEVRRSAIPLLRRLEEGRQSQEARLVELDPVLRSGDVRRGRTVFFGRTAACSTCHLVNSEGGRIGPDLSKIGSIRTGRDLLEAVVFPSASFVRGYEPYAVATQDGRLYTGTLARETVDALFLNGSDAVEVRIPRNQIEDLKQSHQSIMPQGLDAQLTRGELADLLAFLQSLR
jgi:putative membrane-bound dehydrogenase-like protein